jgi:TonB family protein
LGVRIPSVLVKLVTPALLILLYCLPSEAQMTQNAIKARLVGQSLYLRGLWVDSHLKFDAEGIPEKLYKAGTFTEAGMDVREVKLTPGGLRIDGERAGLIFPDKTAKRIRLHSEDYDGSIRIEIKTPVDGDFDKALTAIFAPDLGSLLSSLPIYWQGYARKYLVSPDLGEASTKKLDTATMGASDSTNDGEKPFHVGGGIKPPVVTNMVEPEFSPVARMMKASGIVEVYLWIQPDGSPSHLRIARAAGLGMDEQAISAVSRYRFKPAMKGGKPVKVDLYVDVNFQTF